ncbi:succinyltransferase [Sphingobium sp. SCG-1]|uniref:acyltransferase family protein n=1 Tax=Sphingobium sp. SCG-1 TaxID=2072936 RepID=UPI000CD6A16C|nr:acyltransferase [Sphingobium sp. SCG-1]AUW57698.1 succinyltransferase [Sphingobium sp. SCG-1]
MPITSRSPARNDAIAIARVICILGVVYVHAWTGRTGEELAQLVGSGQEIFRWTLMEGLGKSAVPLLGMISGYLVAGSRRTQEWHSFIAGKARTILLPMVLWNAIAIICVSGAAYAGLILAPQPQSIGWLAEELLALTRPPDINVQMPFLRDLFVCMLAAPLLVRIPVKGMALIAASVAILTIGEWPQPLLLRPLILFFFLFGMVARRLSLAERASTLPAVMAFAPFLLLVPVKIALSLPPAPFITTHGQAMAALDLLTRVAAALFFWKVASALATSRARSALLALEPYAFFLFCCHVTLIWIGGPLLGEWIGPVGSPLYPTFLMVQPLLVLGASIALAHIIMAISPTTAHILSGGRLAVPPKQGRKAQTAVTV